MRWWCRKCTSQKRVKRDCSSKLGLLHLFQHHHDGLLHSCIRATRNEMIICLPRWPPSMTSAIVHDFLQPLPLVHILYVYWIYWSIIYDPKTPPLLHFPLGQPPRRSLDFSKGRSLDEESRCRHLSWRDSWMHVMKSTRARRRVSRFVSLFRVIGRYVWPLACCWATPIVLIFIKVIIASPMWMKSVYQPGTNVRITSCPRQGIALHS